MSLRYHLGCGSIYMKGYVNVDFPESEHTVAEIKADEYSDLRMMEFKPDVVEIRSHHVFEHFGFVDSIALLIKWTLALQKGGVLSIGVPDPQKIVEGMGKLKGFQEAIAMRLLFGSQEAKWAYHINGWSPRLLTSVLLMLGYHIETVESYDGPRVDFPNCWFCVDASKQEIQSKESLRQAGKKLLTGYVVLPQEQRLYELFCKQLGNRIQCWT